MTTPSDTAVRFAPLIAAAERLLSQQTESTIQFTNVVWIDEEEERRNHLFRCTIGNSSAGLPATVILKQIVADKFQPDDVTSWDTMRFFRDWAGAQFLSSLAGEPGYGPRFYGGDRALGFFILEDLGQDQPRLMEPLLQGTAAEAEEALLQYITRLGKMHADTIGKRAQYQAVLHAANPALRAAADDQNKHRPVIEQFCEILTKLNIQTGPALLAELDDLSVRVAEAGDFAAFVHSDPCPDNVLFVNGDVRLIDYEFAYFGHALTDACYPRIYFPTCWCCNRIPQPLVAQLEAAYRAELVRGCPAAADDQRFGQALADVCGAWLLRLAPWQLASALQEESRWGIASMRSRVLARLEAFLSTATEFARLPIYQATTSQLLETLHLRWPEVEPLPVYPAFRQ
jgi:hypothetical protein